MNSDTKFILATVSVGSAVLALAFLLGYEIGSGDLKKVQGDLEWEIGRLEYCESMRDSAEDDTQHYQRMIKLHESRVENCLKAKKYCCWLESKRVDSDDL